LTTELKNDVTIRCRGIKKSYGPPENRIYALRGIDLDIYKSKLTLIVGPSGSGKSTLLSIITTILTPDEGSLNLLGQEMSHLAEEKRAEFCRNNLGIVFQSLFLIPTLTLAENVTLPLLIEGIPREQAMVMAVDKLKMLNMDKRAHSLPGNLSKGQQQRVAIARAMVTDAKIIVCDEPTSALDMVSGCDVMALLQGLSHSDSKTVLVVTHDNRIFKYADRIVTINDGLIAEEKNE
jgi:putative ABC transport system ATP-binding protein